jgi:hypothetical protein
VRLYYTTNRRFCQDGKFNLPFAARLPQKPPFTIVHFDEALFAIF